MAGEYIIENGLIVNGGIFASSITGSFSGSIASSSFATSASRAVSSSFATSASRAVSSSFATTAQNILGSVSTSSYVVNTVTGTNSTDLVYGNMADNDQFRIRIGGTATNAGFVEIATADDGTEPIHVRQYTGVFSSLTRTATLLDGSGNTSFPGRVTATSFTGSLFGTGSTGISGSLAIRGADVSSATKVFHVQTGDGTSIMDFRNATYAFFGCGQGAGAASGFIFNYSNTSAVQFCGYNYGNGSGAYKPILMDTDIGGRNNGIFINYSASQQPASTEFGVKGQGATSATFTAKFQNSGLNDILTIRDDGNVRVTGSLTITGSTTINNILTLIPQSPLPSGAATGSFAVSSSIPPKPFFYNGTTWNALY